MGLLDAIGSGLAEMGAATEKIGLAQMQSAIEEQRAMRLDEMKRSRDKADEEAAYQNKLKRMPEEAEASMKVKETMAPRENALAKNKSLEVDLSPEIAQRKREIKTGDSQSDLDFQTKNIGQIAKNAKELAKATHIVDPSYTAIPNADGTVDMVNSRNPKNVIKLTGIDGKPIIRRDPAELTAASTIINDANTQLKIAEAAYKADPMADGAKVAWEDAQEDAKRNKASALAILLKKTGAETKDDKTNLFPPKNQPPSGTNGVINQPSVKKEEPASNGKAERAGANNITADDEKNTKAAREAMRQRKEDERTKENLERIKRNRQLTDKELAEWNRIMGGK